MYDVIVQIESSSETHTFSQTDEVLIGPSEKASVKVPVEISESDLCSLQFEQDQVTVVPLGQVPIAINGSPITEPTKVELPTTIEIASINISINKNSDLDLESVSSLIEELENSNDSEEKSVQEEIERLTTEQNDEVEDSPIDESADRVKDDIKDIEKFLTSEKSQDAKNSINISDLLEEASSSKSSNDEQASSSKEVEEKATPKSAEEDSLGVEFSDTEPEPEAEEVAPIQEVKNEEAINLNKPKTSTINIVGSVSQTANQALTTKKEIPEQIKISFKARKSFFSKSKSPKWALVLIIILIVFVGLAFIKQQESLKDRNASKAICDLSIAILHESIFQNIPLSSHEMMNEMLIKDIVDSSLINTEDKHHCTQQIYAQNYNLTTYVSKDRKHFILFATSEQGISRLIFPQRSYYVDSKEMILKELPKKYISDISKIGSFESIPNSDFETWKKSAKQFPVAKWSVTPENKGSGFYIPEELSISIHNFIPRIYNYPRYFKASNKAFDLLSKLINSLSNPALNLKASTYFREIETYHDYTYYQLSSLQHLIDFRKELNRYGPLFQSLIFGSVKISPSTGAIIDTKMLPDSIYRHLSYLDEIDEEPTTTSTETVTKAEERLNNHFLSVKKDFNTSVFPLIQRLEEILSDKENVLSHSYPKVIDAAIHRYLMARDETIQPLKKRVEGFYDTFVSKEKNITKQYFFDSLEKSGLSLFTPNSLVLQASELSKNVFMDSSLQLEIDKDLNNLQQASTMDEIINSSKSLSELINSKNFVSPEQFLINNKRFQTLVLNQTEAYLRSLEDKQLTKNQHEESFSKIQTLFAIASINPEIYKQFYNEFFDDLSGEIINIPSRSYNALFENIYQEGKGPILPFAKDESHLKNSNALKKLAETAARIPLKVNPGSSEEEELLGLARIGKQVYFSASILSPGVKRRSDLKDAISLMKEGLSVDQSLWKYILESHFQLLDYPTQELKKALNSNLGFSSFSAHLLLEIKNDLIQFYDIKEETLTKLSLSSNNIQEEIRSFTAPIIYKMSNMISEGITSSRLFIQYFNEYIKTLDQFRSDYQEAKIQGFFTTNRKYQESQYKKLEGKYSDALTLRKKIGHALTSFNLLIDKYQKIINEEISLLDQPNTSNQQAKKMGLNIQSQVFNEIPLGKKVEENLNIQILPIQ